jgi:hypothetical protein
MTEEITKSEIVEAKDDVTAPAQPKMVPVDFSKMPKVLRRELRQTFMHQFMARGYTKQIARTVWDRAIASGSIEASVTGE